MSNRKTANVRDTVNADPRVVRTTHALSKALIELTQERDYGRITVQSILERADVGRTTFYAHYRNKDAVLHSACERLFAMFEPLLDRPSPIGNRVFPVTEFLGHLDEVRGFVNALGRAGQLEYVWDLCAGHAARIMARRIGTMALEAAVIPRPLVASMLAAALMEMIRWREDHPAVVTPAQADAAFHELAWSLAGASPPAPRSRAESCRY